MAFAAVFLVVDDLVRVVRAFVPEAAFAVDLPVGFSSVFGVFSADFACVFACAFLAGGASTISSNEIKCAMDRSIPRTGSESSLSTLCPIFFRPRVLSVARCA